MELKAVILADEFGTRISEESEFILCCGYKANIIKEYFVK